MASLLASLTVALLATEVCAFPFASAAGQNIKRQATIPSFVNTYAPIVYLHSEEQYFPSDIGAQVANTQPQINYASVAAASSPLTLDNLDSLNALGGGSGIYLTSVQDTTTSPQPAWLYGAKPDAAGKTEGAVSSTIIVCDYGNGTVDAYYMYFYAYNWGGEVFGINFGNHVGDWEHNMIRFKNGVPQTIWYSQHQTGHAFTFPAVPTYQDAGLRPIVYSANGSHANYATAGPHDHTIPGVNFPFGVALVDHTDDGYLWDPTLSAYYVSVSFPPGAPAAPVFRAYDETTPTNWLYFKGKWGDQQYRSGTKGQYGIFGQYRYTSGPTGPADKDLNRGEGTCPKGMPNPCVIQPVVLPGNKL